MGKTLLTLLLILAAATCYAFTDDMLELIDKAGVEVYAADGYGSGTIIYTSQVEDNKICWVVTCSHVVGTEKLVKVVFFNGAAVPAAVHTRNLARDIALVVCSISENVDLELIPVPMVNADLNYLEELGFRSILSSLGKIIVKATVASGNYKNTYGVYGQKYFIIQTSIVKGMSGAGLINKKGEMVGMVAARPVITSEGINFGFGLAIPVSEIKEWIQQLDKVIRKRSPMPDKLKGRKKEE